MIKRLYTFSVLVLLSCLSSVAQAQSFNGKTQWSETVELQSYLSSSVKMISVSEGDMVNKGDLLIKMDDSLQQMNVEIMRAKVKALTPQKLKAEMDFNRAIEMYDRTLMSDVDFKNEEFKLAEIVGEYEAVVAKQQKEEFLLNTADLVAPISGVVINVDSKVGQYSHNDQPKTLITLANYREMNAVSFLKISQWDADLIGKKVNVIINKNKFKGTVKSIGLSPIEDAKGLSVFPMVVSFKTSQLIPAGLPLTIEIK